MSAAGERNPAQCWAQSRRGYYCCLPEGHDGPEHRAYIDQPNTEAGLVDRWPVRPPEAK